MPHMIRGTLLLLCLATGGAALLLTPAWVCLAALSALTGRLWYELRRV